MAELFAYLCLVTAAAWVAATIVGVLDQLFYPPLPGRPLEHRGGDPAKVTILIPARNEERNIEACVLSALGQTYPNLEVIVVDDQSTDRTYEILAEMAQADDRLTVVRGEPLPPGWIGKGWALWQGHQRATGAWLFLLDADVRLEPWAIDQAVDFAERKGLDFLNPFPYFTNLTFWEQLLQPLLWGLVRLRFPLIWINRSWAPENMAFGPMMLIRKSVYDAIGGHKPVATDILEDVALAKLLRKRGYRTMVVNGKRIGRVRMYRNLHEIVAGWTKTAYGAMHYNPLLMAIAIVGLFWAATQPPLLLLSGLLAQDQTLAILGGFQTLAMLLRRFNDARENDFPLWPLLLHPLGMFVVHYMQFQAVWRYYFGVYEWKGRAYRKPKPAEVDGDATAPEG